MTHPTEPQLSTGRTLSDKLTQGTPNAPGTDRTLSEEALARLTRAGQAETAAEYDRAVIGRTVTRDGNTFTVIRAAEGILGVWEARGASGTVTVALDELDTETPAEIQQAAPRLGERLTPDAAAYAQILQAAGFTVYVEKSPLHPGTPSALSSWFHYSRRVENGHTARPGGQPILQDCFGTFNDGSDGFDGPHHTMPLKPSRLNGSSAYIGAQWGDADTLGLDNMSPTSVEYARAVARPTNWAPYNHNPDTKRQGTRLANAEPWGIGTHYVPASVEAVQA